MNTKTCIFTRGYRHSCKYCATSENTGFGVHEWNKIRSYIEKIPDILYVFEINTSLFAFYKSL